MNPRVVVSVVRMSALLTFMCANLVGSSRANAQERKDAVEGLVTDTAQHRVPNAAVYLTRAPDRLTEKDSTDPTGQFHFEFVRGSGEYLLVVMASGFQDYRQRLFVDTTGKSSIIVVLRPTVTLKTVKVVSQPMRPPRREGIQPETGASEVFIGGVAAIVSPGDEGNLAAMAASVPGLTNVGNGVSVLGLNPNQNNITLNGLTQNGLSLLPRDLRTATRVSSSSYDPARGGFSGALLAVEMTPGTNYTSKRGSVSLVPESRFPQGGVGINPPLGEAVVSYGTDGALIYDRLYYNVAAQFSQSAKSIIALDNSTRASNELGADEGRLASVFRQALQLGLPSDQARTLGLTDDAVVGARLDFSKTHAASLGASILVHSGVSSGTSVQPFDAPSTGVGLRTSGGTVQLFSTRYTRARTLYDLRGAVSVSDDTERPWVSFPAVLVSDIPPASGPGLPILGYNLGGAQTAANRRRSSSLEVIEEVSRPVTSSLRLRGTFGTQAERVTLTPVGEDFGTFAFSSLSSFGLNSPAVFERSTLRLGASERRIRAFAAASIASGAGSSFQLLSGIRAELQKVSLNDDRSFRFPFEPLVPDVSRLTLSPRIGFTWHFQETRQAAPLSTNALGTFISLPTGIIRGGIGRFVGPLADPGLRDLASETLSCFASDAPPPNWVSYTANSASIPTACNPPSGTQPQALSVLFGSRYRRGARPPESWRGSLGFSSSKGAFIYGVEGLVSWNLSQPVVVDANLSSVPRFVLTGEDRPVFVSPGDINVSDGGVSLGASRLDPAFGRILEYSSTGRSFSHQLSVVTSLAPTALPKAKFSLSYTLAHANGQTDGVDVPAFGGMSEKTNSATLFDYRHQVLLQAGWMFSSGLNASVFVNATSGAPYTPSVSGDVNGDGISYDRAFVFSSVAFSEVGDGQAYERLLATAPRSAADCVRSQFGREARLNSCRAPWSVISNVRVSRHATLGKFPAADISVNLSNPLAMVDRALHGNRQRGWGKPTNVDPVLYSVTGFNAVSQQFRYSPNPQFGKDRLGLGSGAGFLLTLQIKIDFSTPVAEQTLQKFLSPGRGRNPGPRFSPETMKLRYAELVPSIYQQILEQSDSLLLTRSQIAALTAADVPFSAQLDTIWKGLTNYLTALPDNYDAAEALRKVNSATDSAWSLSQSQAPKIKSILAAIQIDYLPLIPRLLITSKERVSIRIEQY